MKRLIFLLVLSIIFVGCTDKVNRPDANSILETKEKNTIELETKEEIKSNLYKKYFSSFDQKKDDEGFDENSQSLDIEKVDNNRKIFIGKGRYLPFFSEESKFYIDYQYDSDNFVFSYIIFKGEILNDDIAKENIIIELIKNEDDIKINQENFAGEEITIINFDENRLEEIKEDVKKLVTNSLFNN